MNIGPDTFQHFRYKAYTITPYDKPDNTMQTDHLIIGLTGGIGSGKTAASDFFSEQGIPVVDADIVARQVVEPGQPAWQAIREHFAPDVLLEDQTLNRAWLREKIFQNPEERTWLESITHPAIRDEIIKQLSQPATSYTILVSPLLFESQQHMLCHRTLLIDVPEKLQIERTSQRDNNSPKQVEAIIRAQMSRTERQIRAHDIILNNESQEQLHLACLNRHRNYLTLAENYRMTRFTDRDPAS